MLKLSNKQIFLWLIVALTTSAQIPTNGLVAYYPFNGNANDESSNSNNGVATGATLTTDRFGNENSAYMFNGNSFINCGNDSTLNIYQDITIVAWIQTDDLVTWQFLVSKGQSSTLGYELWVGATNYLMRVGAMGNGVKRGENAIAGVINTEWTMLTATYNSTEVSMYVNDINVGNISITGPSGIYDAPMLIGAKADGGYYYTGKIDDVRLYNRALQPNEVLAIYQSEQIIQTILHPLPASITDPRPLFSWQPTEQTSTYTIQVSFAPGFETFIVNNVVTDTLYQTITNLPNGLLYWRVINDFSNVPSKVGAFLLNESGTTDPGLVLVVPESYSTLQTAIYAAGDGDVILVTSTTDVASINIIDKNITIMGSSPDGSKITLPSPMVITNSQVTLQNLIILGTQGGTGGTVYQTPTSQCGTIPVGGEGTPALQVENSTLTLRDVELTGGKGGTGGECRSCSDPFCDSGSFPMGNGKGGNGAEGLLSNQSNITIRNSTLAGGGGGSQGGLMGSTISGISGYGGSLLQMTTLDTMLLIFDSLYTDGSSNINPLSITPRHILASTDWPSAIQISNMSGRLLFKNAGISGEEFQLSIHDLKGRTLFSHLLKSQSTLYWPRNFQTSGSFILNLKSEGSEYYRAVTVRQ